MSEFNSNYYNENNYEYNDDDYSDVDKMFGFDEEADSPDDSDELDNWFNESNKNTDEQNGTDEIKEIKETKDSDYSFGNEESQADLQTSVYKENKYSDENASENVGVLKNIPLTKILFTDNKFVNRDSDGTDIDDIKTLANDIKEFGLVHPITVNDNCDGTYSVISGERRCKAYDFLRKTEIPAYVKTEGDKRYKENDEQLITDINNFSANFYVRHYSPVKKLILINEYFNLLCAYYVKEHNASFLAKEKLCGVLNLKESQIQKYLTVGKKINSISQDILDKYDSGDLSFEILYSMVKNSHKNSQSVDINIDSTDDVEDDNDKKTKKSSKSKKPKLDSVICKGTKVGNSNATVTGYLVSVNDDCFIKPESGKIECADESKDKYVITLYKVDKDSVELL